MSQPEFRIEVNHVKKCFGKKTVLSDVSFRLQPGRIAAIVGENGAGKTTLLEILVGMIAADSGTIAINGTIGYCPQGLHVFETLTVNENFDYYSTAYGIKEKTKRAAIQRGLMDLFCFNQYNNTLVSRLSGGTKQKLNLCLAVLDSPDLLLLDEPYSAFDWETYLHFWEFAGEQRKAGRSILVVSHFIHDKSSVDVVLELEEGKLVCAG
jgi:ABC-2 type transport system ATP-binding protein